MKKNKKLSFVFLGIIFLIIVVIVAVSVFSKLEGSLSKVNIGKVEYSLKNYHQRFNMQILEDFVLLGEEEYERYTVGGILPSSVFRLPDKNLFLSIHLSNDLLEDKEESLESYMNQFIAQDDREIRASGILRHHRHFVLHMELFDEKEQTITHLVIFSADKKVTLVAIHVLDDENILYQEAIQGMLNSITVK